MREIALRGTRAAGKTALVDDEDYELVSKHHWLLEVRQRGNGVIRYYARTADHPRRYMHKMITGWPETDHENSNGLDNRRSNLRRVTRAQNCANSRKRPGVTSRFKGVSWHSAAAKWEACIYAHGRKKHLGVFVNEEDAAKAYDREAKTLRGEFARLNFPVGSELSS